MRYVVKDRRTGRYLARAPRIQSYTQSLKKAELFKTREEAQRECCPDSDYVVELIEELRAGR